MIKRSSFIPITVAENLTWKDFAKISVNLPSLPGIIPEVGLTRHYQEYESYAHIVGYVGPISDKDLESEKPVDPVLQIPKFQIGKVGVEKKLEAHLRGRAGVSKVEVNASGRVMRELNRTQGKSGENIHLTIATNLQKFASERLKGMSASSVLIDIKSGDILSLVSTPSYNPNNFVLGISHSDWNDLLNDERKPLLNKATSGAYPPGSTFKMVVAAAALELGLIGLNDKIFCAGFYELGSRKFHCWLKGGHGKLTLQEGIQKSCDVYFYEVARKVGVKRIGDMARRLGLGQAYNLPLTGLSKGFVPTKKWKKERFGTSWLVGDTLNVGIGQGFSLATPLQLAVMTARLASGKEVTPNIIKNSNKNPDNPKDLSIKENTLVAIRKGMFDVLNEKDGTAFNFRTTDENFLIAGKTGTSQVRRITREEREEGVIKNEDLPWKMRDHALFTCFAPYKNPKYALSVVVEHGGSGSKVAAPIARDIMLFQLYGGIPPVTAYPDKQQVEVRNRLMDIEKKINSRTNINPNI
jgi:penicillin-binding protein 2